MRIEHVYITGNRRDLRFTQCCVASIRRWYPDIPITLVKDEANGPYSTRELEEAWDVRLFRSDKPLHGQGWTKLEPLLQHSRQQCLILDSDIVFLGRVIEALEAVDADFVVESRGGQTEDIVNDYYDPAALAELDPAFVLPGFTFNVGQLAGTSGLLKRADFEPYMRFDEAPRIRNRDVFKADDQGILNYVLVKKAQEGELTLERLPFMEWAGSFPRRKVRVRRLDDQSPYPFLMHWAGPKRKIFGLMRHGRLLRHFETLYYSRIPGGRITRYRRLVRMVWSMLTGSEALSTKAAPRRRQNEA